MSKLKQYKMFIGGNWVDSETRKTFETLNPENNKPWALVPEASSKDVDDAVKAAHKAFEGEWPKLLPQFSQLVLLYNHSIQQCNLFEFLFLYKVFQYQ